MGLMKQPKSWLRKFEKLHMGLKFVILGGSAYLLYRKFQKEGEPIPIIGSVLPSATTPLATPTTTPLTGAGANEVAYRGASPDQLNTTRQLVGSGTTPLTPEALLTAAVQTGGREVLLRQGMEEKKATDIASAGGGFLQTWLPSNAA